MSSEQKLITFVLAGAACSRLDKLLCERLSEFPELKGYSRSQIKHWIDRGAVWIDGERARKAGEAVRPGAHITVRVPNAEPATLVPYDLAVPVLYEDEALIVVDKPAGLSMHPGAGNRTKTLVNALAGKLSGGLQIAAALRPGVVHRLDKDTTGVVVLAKTLEAHAQLVRQFSAHSVERAYQALLVCAPRARHAVARQDQGTITADLGRHPRQRTKFTVVGAGGKRAVSHWRVLERMPYAALVEVRLETGRTHQIRVHMHHLGAPVIGDRSYGDFAGLPPELCRAAGELGRQALHARLLGFEHPLSRAKLCFESKLPSDFEAVLKHFREWR